MVKDGVGLLVYREKRGSFAECIRAGQVPQALFEIHDIYGHYSTRITLGRALGKYYWPNRYRDIEKYCKSCPQCQLVGPKIVKESPRTITVLEPIAMFTIDFIGLFNPPSAEGHR